MLRINYSAIGVSRNDVMRNLASQGIGTQVHYIPVNRQPYYQSLDNESELTPNADDYYHDALSIPLYYSLTDEQQKLVIEAVLEVLTP